MRKVLRLFNIIIILTSAMLVCSFQRSLYVKAILSSGILGTDMSSPLEGAVVFKGQVDEKGIAYADKVPFYVAKMPFNIT